MNRRIFSFAAISVSIASIAGCDSESKPSRTATLLDNEKVHTAMTEIDDAVGALEEQADNFDSENWRDVVPEIKSSAEELRNAVASLREALGYSR